MDRVPYDQADLLLDTWGWRCASLVEVVAGPRKLAGYRGATWPDWDATLARLHAVAPAATQAWFARRALRPRTEAARPTRWGATQSQEGAV